MRYRGPKRRIGVLEELERTVVLVHSAATRSLGGTGANINLGAPKSLEGLERTVGALAMEQLTYFMNVAKGGLLSGESVGR